MKHRMCEQTACGERRTVEATVNIIGICFCATTFLILYGLYWIISGTTIESHWKFLVLIAMSVSLSCWFVGQVTREERR